MSDSDNWERDPSVRMMRRLFGRMEEKQRQLLDSLGISPFDERLRRWRKTARNSFEQRWEKAIQSNVMINEEKAVDIYINGFAKILRSDGIDIPFTGLMDNTEI